MWAQWHILRKNGDDVLIRALLGVLSDCKKSAKATKDDTDNASEKPN